MANRKEKQLFHKRLLKRENGPPIVKPRDRAEERKQFILKELDILGSRGATRNDFDDVIAMLEQGVYPVGETITRSVPFEQGAQAMIEWNSNPAAVTRIQIEL